jgi:uncharacterized protein YbjT (DUF2867 family)
MPQGGNMIVITGATGNTGKLATEMLFVKGEKVRVIGRDAKRLDPFVQKGAEAFIGEVEDAASMAKAFDGATAVYLVIPQAMHLDNFRAYQERISDAYAAAIASARVPYVVTLSSIGAHHAKNTGPIVGLHNMEEKLNRIPGLNVLHLRPTYFMENFLMGISTVRSMNIFPGAMPADMPFQAIATKDIGIYAAQRLHSRDFSGSSTQELLGSRDVTMKKVTSIIGKAIGKPGLQYMQVPFEMMEQALIQMGLPKSSAELMIEMGKAGNSGLLAPQESCSAKNTTPSTIEWFASEVFAPAYLGTAAKT